MKKMNSFLFVHFLNFYEMIHSNAQSLNNFLLYDMIIEKILFLGALSLLTKGLMKVTEFEFSSSFSLTTRKFFLSIESS